MISDVSEGKEHAACSSGHLRDRTNQTNHAQSYPDLVEAAVESQLKLKPVRPLKKKRLSESIKHIPVQKNRVTMKLVSNISLVVKKFAAFLFQERGLDIEKDSLNYEQFK